MNEQEKRQRLLASMRERIADLLPADGDHAATMVGMLAMAIIAENHPPKLTKSDKQKIRDNYPDATDDLIKERALSDTGLTVALALSTQLAQIAVDYSPSTHCKTLMDSDDHLAKVVGPMVAQQLASTWTSARHTGMSAFGTACTMILVATTHATHNGVPLPLLIRPLLNAVGIAFSSGTQPKIVEEEAIQFLMQQMQISRSAAKKYVAAAKQTTGS